MFIHMPRPGTWLVICSWAAAVAPCVVLWLKWDSARTHIDSKRNHIPYAYLAVCSPFRRCSTLPQLLPRRSASSASDVPAKDAFSA